MGLTDDRNDPRLKNVGPDGMQEAYLVLSEEERKKGFVRPVRRSYVHVGRAICGIPNVDLFERRSREGGLPPGAAAYLCADLPGHDGECSSWVPATEAQLERFGKTGYLGGCGTHTRMGTALAETYARQPDFYGATYCCGCKTHPRVGAHGEFVWADEVTGEPLPLWVGT